MNGSELLRIVDAIHRDKSIDPELIFQSIEQALSQATKKALNLEEAPAVTIDRSSGGISATVDLFMLHQLGYDALTLYDASMGEWARDASLPIETDVPGSGSPAPAGAAPPWPAPPRTASAS